MKRAIRQQAIRAGLEACHVAARLGLGRSGPRAVIFTLHHVRPARQDGFNPNAHLEVTPDFLNAAITALKADGHQFVSLEALGERLASGGRDTRLAAFTLDDGYRDNRDHAYPVFRRHGVPFTVFLTEGFSERRVTIWWETLARWLAARASVTFDFGHEVEEIVALPGARARQRAFDRIAAAIRSARQYEMIAQLDRRAAEDGIDPVAIVRDEVMDAAELSAFSREALVSLGAHTLTHPSLAHLGPETLASEIAGSITYVEQLTGERPTTLAYPYGDRTAADVREFEAARHAGLALAVTTRPGLVDLSGPNGSMALNRVSLNGLFQKPRYVRALASGLPFGRARRQG